MDGMNTNVNWNSSLAALGDFLGKTSAQDIEMARRNYALGSDITTAGRNISRDMERQERAKNNTRRRQGRARFFSTLGGIGLSLIPGVGPFAAAALTLALSSAAQAFARRHRLSLAGISGASAPNKIGSNRFFNDKIGAYNRSLDDWRRDLTVAQGVGALSNAFSVYNAAAGLDKAGYGTFRDIGTKIGLIKESPMLSPIKPLRLSSVYGTPNKPPFSLVPPDSDLPGLSMERYRVMKPLFQPEYSY